MMKDMTEIRWHGRGGQGAKTACLLLADADYFSVGTIDTKQLLDYARRRGMEVDEVKKIIPNNV